MVWTVVHGSFLTSVRVHDSIGSMGAADFDVKRALLELGDPSMWERPEGYRSSLALCVVDSIWSLGIRYQTVEKVLDRYLAARGYRGLEDAQACSDGPGDLLDWFMSPSGGSGSNDRFAEIVGSRNRTSSTNGVLKAEAVFQACTLLKSMAINTTADLISHADVVEPRWLREVKGQASGISWKYLLMLAGQSGVKPDRMVKSFMQRMGASTAVNPDAFVQVLVEVINQEGIDATAVDHQIWLVERGSSSDELQGLQALVNQFAEVRDWDQFHTVKNLFLALVGEVGEVAELIQWKNDSDLELFLATEEGRDRMGEEIADVFIYLMRLAEKAGIDLAHVTHKKLSVNEEKYPVGSSRGNATKYNERH